MKKTKSVGSMMARIRWDKATDEDKKKQNKIMNDARLAKKKANVS